MMFQVHTPTMLLLQREKHLEFVTVSVSQAILALSLVDEVRFGYIDWGGKKEDSELKIHDFSA